ncbi:MAG: hypothetical protein ACYC66_18010 [Chloroflexota bacterium]
MERKSVNPEIALGFAQVIGLAVDEERAATLAPEIQSLRIGINAMDEVDLTDVEPATIYPLKRI